MCRWFAFISHESVLLEDVLIDPQHAVTKVTGHYLPGLLHQIPGELQSQIDVETKDAALRNLMFNIDGFGVAWYNETRSKYEPEFTTGPRPVLYRTVAPVLTDSNFLSICANTDSKCIFAHVRAASAPPIVPTNNHPFIFGIHAFMHNGGVTNFAQIRKALVDKISVENVAQIKGSSDTEHVAALYFTHLGDTSKAYPVEKMRDALAATLRDIQLTQKAVLSPEVFAVTANSLNLCTTDGKQMVAVRYRNSATQQPPTLYISTEAGIILNRKTDVVDTNEVIPNFDPTLMISSARELSQPEHNEHGKHVIVASEPTTFDTKLWRILDKNDYISVDKDMKIYVGPLQV